MRKEGDAEVAVHPRACGEQKPSRMIEGDPRGSSPRLRGTEPTPGFDRAGQRFIPALAGNRARAHVAIIAATVHPRACGEQWMTRRRTQAHSGSSPRLRGTVCRSAARRELSRFIPALAGNRSACRVRWLSVPVHPRAGEQWASCRLLTAGDGSSPRLRGTGSSSPRLRGTSLSDPTSRFIPALANS